MDKEQFFKSHEPHLVLVTTDGVNKSDREDPAAETTVLLHDEEADVPDDIGPVRDALHHHLRRVPVLVPGVVHTVVAGDSVVSVVETVVQQDGVGVVRLHGHH